MKDYMEIKRAVNRLGLYVGGRLRDSDPEKYAGKLKELETRSVHVVDHMYRAGKVWLNTPIPDTDEKQLREVLDFMERAALAEKGKDGRRVYFSLTSFGRDLMENI